MRVPAILLFGLVAATSVQAQKPIVAIGGGVGVVKRPERQATLGLHFSISSHWRLSEVAMLGLEAMGDRYAPWNFSSGLCPPQGCPPDHEARTYVGGLLVTGILRRDPDDSAPANFIYPILGPGIYGVSEDSETRVAVGLSGGLGAQLHSHLVLELRYHWISGDSRVDGFLPLTLSWIF